MDTYVIFFPDESHFFCDGGDCPPDEECYGFWSDELLGWTVLENASVYTQEEKDSSVLGKGQIWVKLPSLKK